MNHRLVPAVVCAALAACGSRRSAPEPVVASAQPRDAAGFDPGDGGVPEGWTARPAETIHLDDHVLRDGRHVVRIARTATSPEAFSVLVQQTPLDVTGTMIELRGALRTEDVDGFVGLWMREDGESETVAFENMQKRALAGTTDWASYAIQLPVHADATDLSWGVLLQGTGTAWADDLELFVDGRPIARAPHVTRAETALDRDHQFDHGSGIAVAHPTAIQIKNLVTLAKVWGFLKYHHPAITSGTKHWDYELLRVLPSVLAAPDRAAADAALVRWIDGLGPVAACHPCAKLSTDGLAVRPELGWIDDRVRLGSDLVTRLRAIYDNRVPYQQFFVSLALGLNKPEFHHEPRYDAALPDAGFQLLALFRFWNIIEYWAPDRALADSPWDAVLAELVPEVMSASTTQDYHRAMLRAIAHQRDGHAWLAGAEDAQPPVGSCRLPIDVRFVERHAVVTKLHGPDTGLEVGDELIDVDGVAVDQLIARWSPYYSASNDTARLRHIAAALPQGDCTQAALGIDRSDRSLRVSLARTHHAESGMPWHDRAGPTFRLLSPDVAYLKLSSVKAHDVAQYIEQAADTKGLVVDIRNYPSEFVVFALGALLVDHTVPFARFTSADLSNPGAFYWGDAVTLEPEKPHYPGKVVVLVDDVSQSQSEYTAMALRAAPHTTIAGSTTAGADGNVSSFAMPGGLRTVLSGLGVFYPDRRATQGVGIVPDISVAPTIAGIRAGRDEVLEAAIRSIVGAGVAEADIRRLARPADEPAPALGH
jgi:C-terminal processing protease CtpA/Prc